MPGVLIADSDERFAKSLSGQLTEQRAQIFVAPSLDAALDILKSAPISIAIANIRMTDPERRLWRSLAQRRIPVIAIADVAQAPGAADVCAKELGSFAYCEKPVNLAALAQLALNRAPLSPLPNPPLPASLAPIEEKLRTVIEPLPPIPSPPAAPIPAIDQTLPPIAKRTSSPSVAAVSPSYGPPPTLRPPPGPKLPAPAIDPEAATIPPTSMPRASAGPAASVAPAIEPLTLPPIPQGAAPPTAVGMPIFDASRMPPPPAFATAGPEEHTKIGVSPSPVASPINIERTLIKSDVPQHDFADAETGKQAPTLSKNVAPSAPVYEPLSFEPTRLGSAANAAPRTVEPTRILMDPPDVGAGAISPPLAAEPTRLFTDGLAAAGPIAEATRSVALEANPEQAKIVAQAGRQAALWLVIIVGGLIAIVAYSMLRKSPEELIREEFPEEPKQAPVAAPPPPAQSSVDLEAEDRKREMEDRTQPPQKTAPPSGPHAPPHVGNPSQIFRGR
jgi:CheY-like chemotaxis protein